MTKKNVLISFVTEAETDLNAVFDLNKIFLALSENDLKKFDGDCWTVDREVLLNWLKTNNKVKINDI